MSQTNSPTFTYVINQVFVDLLGRQLQNRLSGDKAQNGQFSFCDALPLHEIALVENHRMEKTQCGLTFEMDDVIKTMCIFGLGDGICCNRCKFYFKRKSAKAPYPHLTA